MTGSTLQYSKELRTRIPFQVRCYYNISFPTCHQERRKSASARSYQPNGRAWGCQGATLIPPHCKGKVWHRCGWLHNGRRCRVAWAGGPDQRYLERLHHKSPSIQSATRGHDHAPSLPHQRAHPLRINPILPVHIPCHLRCNCDVGARNALHARSLSTKQS